VLSLYLAANHFMDIPTSIFYATVLLYPPYEQHFQSRNIRLNFYYYNDPLACNFNKFDIVETLITLVAMVNFGRGRLPMSSVVQRGPKVSVASKPRFAREGQH